MDFGRGVPPRPPSVSGPEPVDVRNWPKRAKDFFDVLSETRNEVKQQLDEHQALEMQCFTPAGDVLRVANVRYTQGSETLLLSGIDGQGAECHILSQPQGLQLFLRVLTFSGRERKPKKIGFTVEEVPRGENP
jgi:hypothetical protein